MFKRIYSLLVCTLLLCSVENYGQRGIIVYDGYTGIYSTAIQNDTAVVAMLVPGGPAEKAGIEFLDKIIAINDSLICGEDLNQRILKDLFHQRSGESIDLLIKRRGVDSLMHFSFNREPYLNEIVAFDYEYLIDSLEQYTFSQINSASLDSLFCNPLIAKTTVFSVEEGSPADKFGFLPGDRVISLEEEMDKDFHFSISSGVLSVTTIDTTITILRGDSLIHLEHQADISNSFEGVESKFDHDFSSPCAWLRIKTENRISEDRVYLLNLPEMTGTDSANFYLPQESGTWVEKRTGILIPVEERDYIYKDWHAAIVPMEKGAEQTFYIRWKADSHIGAPVMHLIAHETMVWHDRIERMVLFVFLGMMMIIAIFFLILYFALHDRQYIYFSLYILFFAAFLFVSEGYLGEFLWKASMAKSLLVSNSRAFTLSLLSICFLLFGSTYLELKKNLRGWYISVLVLTGLIGLRVVIMLLGSVFNFQMDGLFEVLVVFIWAFSVAIIPLFLLIVPGILRIRSGFNPAWYFLLANLVLIPLALLTIDSSAFSFSADKVNESIMFKILQLSGVYVAAILQILIFSLGLARKMKLDEQERKKAQLLIIDQLKENEKLKDKVNRELEQKVQERTREISEQKEEIESQRDEIEAQRDLVFAQKKEITDSIGYAQRIQAALLPHKSYLDALLPEYFVFYKPRDIVSGDFYWIKELDSSLIVVVADCTGHGVPGAFMSMLGITLLNELFVDGQSSKPGELLGELRTKLKAMLAQQGGFREQKDGMDMAIALIDRKKKELQFAGAYNPLYLIREDKGRQLMELKGDRQPIGVHWEETEFSTQLVPLKERDSIYIFTDGYVDQYGGEDRKKFKTQKFKELLLTIQPQPLEKQRQVLEESFEAWRGNVEQIDDVCVVGIRV